MGSRVEQASVQEGAVEQLEAALAADESDKKDFHLRQALQLLDVAFTDK